jgi:hypothetical protein
MKLICREIHALQYSIFYFIFVKINGYKYIVSFPQKIVQVYLRQKILITNLLEPNLMCIELKSQKVKIRFFLDDT